MAVGAAGCVGAALVAVATTGVAVAVATAVAAAVAVAELLERHVVTAALAHRVAVHPQALHVGKTRANFGLQPLGADSQIQ